METDCNSESYKRAWELYYLLKQDIINQNLTPREYEIAINKLVDKLGI